MVITQLQRMNNLGADLIASGKYEQGIETLKRVLVVSKQHLDNKRKPADNDNKGLYLDQFIRQDSIPSASDNGTRDNPYDYIYDSPIRLVGNPQSDTIAAMTKDCHVPTTEQYDGVVCAISIFNLALSFHKIAIQKKHTKSFYLKALNLYDYVLRLVEDPRRSDGCTFFIMTVVNNMGQIYVALEDDMNAESTFRRLHSLVMYFLNCHGQELALHVNGFVQNLFYLIFSTSTMVAAAA